MQTKKVILKKSLKAAFPKTIPILAGFLFLGSAFGIYMKSASFNVLYSLLTSTVIFAGSMQFALVGLLATGFNPLHSFMITLMINARHLFYGMSMLDKYKFSGIKKLYLIFGMCDETFSINYIADIPEDVDKGWFMFFVTLLNQIYWIAGTAIGGILGSALKFSTEGIDFVMTSLFVVIFLEQWAKKENRHSAVIGGVISIVCLILFGRDNFIIPSMLLILGALSFSKKVTALN